MGYTRDVLIQQTTGKYLKQELGREPAMKWPL